MDHLFGIKLIHFSRPVSATSTHSRLYIFRDNFELALATSWVRRGCRRVGKRIFNDPSETIEGPSEYRTGYIHLQISEQTVWQNDRFVRTNKKKKLRSSFAVDSSVGKVQIESVVTTVALPRHHNLHFRFKQSLWWATLDHFQRNVLRKIERVFTGPCMYIGCRMTCLE